MQSENTLNEEKKKDNKDFGLGSMHNDNETVRQSFLNQDKGSMVDMRQSITFQNQAKFWLDEHEILLMYEKKQKSLSNKTEEIDDDEYDSDNEKKKQRALEQLNELNSKIVFMQGGCKAFSFSKSISSGQYVLPFSFKLPENIPGTFQMDIQDGKTNDVHNFQVCYTIEVFINSDDDPTIKNRMYKKHEFEVREYLFTDAEIQNDVDQQRTAN